MRTKHVLLTLAANVAMQLAGVVTGILAARLLGPSQRGEFATVTLYPSLFVSLGQVGLDQAVTLRVCRQPGRVGSITASALVVASALGLAMWAGAWLALPALLGPQHADLVGLARTCAVVIPLSAIAVTLLGIDLGKSAFRVYNALRTLGPAVYLVGVVGLWVCGRASVAGLTWALVASVVVAFVARLVRAAPDLLRDHHPSWSMCTDLVRVGGGLYAVTLVVALTTRADQMVVSRLLSNHEMGIYVVATTVAGGILVLSQAVSTVGFAATGGAEGLGAAVRVMVSQFRHAMLALSISGVVLAAAAYPLIRFAFGHQFVAAAGPAAVLVAAMAVMGLTRVLQESLKAMGQWRSAAASEVLALVAMLGAGIMLTRPYGLYGAASAVLAARVVGLCALLLPVSARYGVSLRSYWGLDRATLATSVGLVASQLRPRARAASPVEVGAGDP